MPLVPYAGYAPDHGAGAWQWLEAVLISDKYALKRSKFHLASCLRLGCNLPFNHWLDTCDYGNNSDKLVSNL